MPHLLVWGDDEKLIKVAVGEWVASQLPAAEVVLIPGSGHCLMWEQPDRFNEVVTDWVARH